MRKIASYGAAALLTVSAMAVGVSYAQDTTTTTTDEVAASVARERPWLGVSVSETENGVTITRISAGSPAETAELQVDDVIVAINDTAVESADDLLAAVEAASAWDVLTLMIERDAEEISVEVTLDARTAGGPRGMFSDPLQITEQALGVTLEAAEDGYTVVAVDEDSPFALEVGDVITAVNDEALASLDWRSLFDPSGENTVTLTVQRDDEEVSIEGALALFAGRQGMPPDGLRDGNGQRGNNPPMNGDSNWQPGGAPPADAPVDAPPADADAV